MDIDADAARTYRHNFPAAAFIEKDIRRIETRELREHVRHPPGDFLLFSACAPCAPFSKQRRDKRRNDPRTTLFWDFLRFVQAFKPDFIFVENVPGLRLARIEQRTFSEFQNALERFGYVVKMQTVNSCDYGVPQRRKRLVLLASLHSGLSYPYPTHGPERGRPYVAVWDAIGRFPRIAAGAQHPVVPNHRAAALSERNIERLRHTPPGGGRQDWPPRLRLRCHKDYGGHTDVYGRLRKAQLASGLTTRCISLSNGRFGHPSQNRAISLREAASLQTFKDDFIFFGSLNSMAKQVGNAVPVILAKTFAMEFRRLADAVRRHRV
jgi:DNA (cytosine-5)-methyltransferase 1